MERVVLHRALIRAACLVGLCLGASATDVPIADFEGETYGDWEVAGEAFGPGPAQGTLPDQNPVSGYLGKGLVNTFFRGDRTVGTLTSTPFVIACDYLNALVGGGAHEGRTCMNLLVGGAVVRTMHGRNSERLEWQTWDVARLRGQEARLQIVDRETGGWGHINIDHIVLSNTPAAEPRGDPEAEQRRLEAARARLLPRLRALGVTGLLFAVRMVDTDGHWYANFGTWSDNPSRRLYHDGARLCRLDLETGRVDVLLDDATGGIRDPQVHYDGDRILFSYRVGGQPYHHLHEIGVDGSDLTRLTAGPYDDIEPTYVPDGGIVFCSSRAKRMVNCYYTRVAILHRCNRDGSGIRMLSSNIEHDNTPWPLPDGRLLHQRWEYIDRSQTWYHHLWTMNPDGTAQVVYYGNQQVGTVMLDAKPIPGTNRVVASFSPGHGQNEHAGHTTIVTPDLGPDDKRGARRLSDRLDRDPFPLAEDLFLVARGTAIEALEGNGERTVLYALPPEWCRADGRMQVHEPRPLNGRRRERVIPHRVDPRRATGTVLLDDVTVGRRMDGVEPGDIRELLVLEALPKPVNFSGGWEPVSYGGTFTLVRVLGRAPVAADGSAHIELPALRSLFFVALDGQGRSVKRMQSFLTVQPGEVLGCVGCHEQRTQTPAPRRSRAGYPLAARQPAVPPIPYADTPEVFDYPRDIQPILDRHCAACHGYAPTARGGPRAGGVILTGDRGPFYSHSYITLTLREQVSDGRNADGNRAPRSIGSAASPLLDKLAGGHHGVQASSREQLLARLWIETGAAYPGTYAALGTGMIGRDGKAEGWGAATKNLIEARCGRCHEGPRRLPQSPADDVVEVGFAGTRINPKDPRYRFSNHLLYNLSRPAQSLLLLAPLAREHGGWAEEGLTAAAAPTGIPSHPVIFRDPGDAGYQTLLAAVQATAAQLERLKRFDMPGFRPNAHYLREMVGYGVLQALPAETVPVDPYQLDRAYWASLWHRVEE